MARDLTKQQVAAAFGVSARTVNRWLEQGCPHTRVTGKPRMNREEVARWRATGAGDDAPGEARKSAPSASLGNAELARRRVVARRGELELAQEKGLKDLDLGDRILAAETYTEFKALTKQIWALVARGTLSPPRARALLGWAAENRKALKDTREVEGDDDPERFHLVSQEALHLVEDFEWIVSDTRRAEIREHMQRQRALDEEEHPNVDLADGVPEEPETQTGEEEPA